MIVNKERMLKDIKALKRIKKYCYAKQTCYDSCVFFKRNSGNYCTILNRVPSQWNLKELKNNIEAYEDMGDVK